MTIKHAKLPSRQSQMQQRAFFFISFLIFRESIVLNIILSVSKSSVDSLSSKNTTAAIIW